MRPAADDAGVTRVDLFAGRRVDLTGGPWLRGTAHGEQLRELIAEAMERWRQDLAERGDRHPDAYVADFLGATRFGETVSRLCPDLDEEVRAIAAGSNQPADQILAYNLMDEDWLYARETGGGCSVIGAATASGQVVLSQNLDLPLSRYGSQAVLRIEGDGGRPGQLVLTCAGMIGLFGVNAAGVACCVNTLKTLPSARRGMPVAFVVRQLLTHRDAASAGAYLAAVPHASGQHYAVADPASLRGYECSAAGCAAGPVADELLHTNHPIWWSATPLEEPVADETPSTSQARLAALESGLAEVRRSGDAEPLLSSTAGGLCVQPSSERKAATFCSARFTLTAPPAVRVALGNPAVTPWCPVAWPDSS